MGLQIILWILLGAGVLLVLDRLLLWMEAKGWIYWRKVKRKGSAAGIFLGGNVFDPGAAHLAEAIEEHVIAEEDDGDDDDKRKPEDQVT